MYIYISVRACALAPTTVLLHIFPAPQDGLPAILLTGSEKEQTIGPASPILGPMHIGAVGSLLDLLPTHSLLAPFRGTRFFFYHLYNPCTA